MLSRTQSCSSSTLSIFNRLSASREIGYILSVQFSTPGSEIYCTGEHISLNPVSKVDGILAKIFIYNILQQRLDRLLLAVLRRKRGRSVHEWVCRLGWGSAGRSAGGGAEDQANRRIHQRGRRRRLHLLQDPKGLTGDTWEVKMLFTRLTWDFWKGWLSY